MTKKPDANLIVGSMSKELVNSWDLFDTLVSRFYPDPAAVFKILGARHPELDFVKRRLQAQSSLDKIGAPYTLHDIYAQMVGQGLAEHLAQELIAQELKLEQELLFPIRSTIAQVAPGDIVVTDMYLSDQMISDILWQVCHLKQLTKPVIRSNWGKATGSLWPELLRHYVIRTHHGDNLRSDVDMPRRFGIATRHMVAAQLSPWESRVTELGHDHLALLLREARLRALPANASSAHEVMAGPYLTLLYAYAQWLHACYAKSGVQFIFLRRDGEDLSRLFSALFAHARVKQIDLNRHMVAVNHADFNQILAEQIKPDGLLVDVVASGRSVLKFVAQANVKYHKFVTLLYLDKLLTANEIEAREGHIRAGQFDFVQRQSALEKHHYPLECLLQTLCPPVVSLGYDARSGGLIRSHGPSDLSGDEMLLISCKNDLLQEFISALQRRTYKACSAAEAVQLISASLSEILGATDLPKSFPSFLAREKNT